MHAAFHSRLKSSGAVKKPKDTSIRVSNIVQTIYGTRNTKSAQEHLMKNVKVLFIGNDS